MSPIPRDICPPTEDGYISHREALEYVRDWLNETYFSPAAGEKMPWGVGIVADMVDRALMERTCPPTQHRRS